MFDSEIPQIIVHSDVKVNYAVHDVKWVPESASFVVLGTQANGCGKGEVYTLNCELGGRIEKRREFGRCAGFRCGTFGATNMFERYFSTADFLGRLQVWDLDNMSLPVFLSQRHQGAINSIDGVAGGVYGCGAPEIATAGEDGLVMIWDVRSGQNPVATLTSNMSNVGATCLPNRKCWAVTFGNAYCETERSIVAGYANGDLKLFDLRSMSVRWEHNLQNGITCLQFDKSETEMNRLLVSTEKSLIHVFDMQTFHPVYGYASLTERAHDSAVWQGKHMPQNNEIFVTTGGAGSVCLWNYVYPEKYVDIDEDGLEMGVMGELLKLQDITIAEQDVTSFDWCCCRRGVGVCSSLDNFVRVLIVSRLASFC